MKASTMPYNGTRTVSIHSWMTAMILLLWLSSSLLFQHQSGSSLQLFRRRRGRAVAETSPALTTTMTAPSSATATTTTTSSSSSISSPTKVLFDDSEGNPLNGNILPDDPIVKVNNVAVNDDRTTTVDDSCFQFEAPFMAQSNPLRIPDLMTKNPTVSLSTNLIEFLSDPNHLTFGPKVSSMVWETSKLSQDIIDKWKTACGVFGEMTEPPDLTVDRVVSIKTHGLSIPGLTVEWSAILGTKVVSSSRSSSSVDNSISSSSLPYLELILIEDECQACGARPLVWTFRKMLGKDKKRKKRKNTQTSQDHGDLINSSSSTTTSSLPNPRRRETQFLTRLSFVPDDDDDDNDKQLRLTCSGTMKMKFPIPRILNKKLFRTTKSKQTSEQKLASLIANQIEMDVKESCLVDWEQKYNTYFHSNDDNDDNGDDRSNNGMK